MSKTHHYNTTVTWTGNSGVGTTRYNAYSRAHEISAEGRVVIPASSDPAFRGDPSRYSPEDLLVSSLSACHMLWYLHLCAANDVIVVDYVDHALGEMVENDDGSGQFAQVTLQPRVTVATETMVSKAKALHDEANKLCFIARSVNFPVSHMPEIVYKEGAAYQ